MRRVAIAASALLGLAAAVLLELGDRSACPLDGGSCVIGPTYAWLHPGAPAFNHVFGALVVLLVVVLPPAVSVYLWRRRA